ncbi:MAG: thrombospondin type 3 repeat-containing protein [Planctomycetaceae bacterium]
MKLDIRFNPPSPITTAHRRGSTLVIVVALLGLLAFMGMVFYSFAAQERAASENFSDAAKFAVDEPSNVFDHMLRQVIVGPANTPSERASILASSTNRHSLVRNLVGYDIHPHTGDPIEVEVNANGIPFVPRPRLAVDSDGDGVGDIIDRDNDGNPDPADWLEFVDSPSARVHVGYRERGLEGNQPPFVAPPAPDVDYTYPDINNLFLAYRGTAIRDNRDTNGNTPPGKSTFEEVKVIIPSFFRPQYMKSVANNGPGGSSVPTDVNWIAAWDGQNANRGNVPYPARGFRPHPRHIAGRLENGNIVFRYVADDDPEHSGSKGASRFILNRTPTTPTTTPHNWGKWGSGPGRIPKSTSWMRTTTATESTKASGWIWPTPSRRLQTARNTPSCTPSPSTTLIHCWI